MVKLRPYDAEKDREATHRIWVEVGWLEDDEKKLEMMDRFVASGRAIVAEIHGEAESLVLSTPGTFRYLEEDLPFAGVSGVTTSRVARKRGLAGRLTARLIAEDVAAGAAVSGLGMFEQGYYNKLGYGTGRYELWASFDPAQLRVPQRPRFPSRLGREQASQIHQCRQARRRGHGSINLDLPITTEADMFWTKEGFGLGYYDGPEGELTHHFWCDTDGGSEHGPYSVWWLAFQTLEQFVELLALIQSLGDQVRKVSLREPVGVQLQDFLRQPFRFQQLTARGKYENRISGSAYTQTRICDLKRCLEHTHLPDGSVRFNLKLSDPIERYLDSSQPWRGIGGEYIVTLGPESEARPGQDAALPILEASVGSFTRLWLGVLPASGLAISDELAGPPPLLETLDQLLRLPRPSFDWDF